MTPGLKDRQIGTLAKNIKKEHVAIGTKTGGGAQHEFISITL
jgi:hypothetical protein